MKPAFFEIESLPASKTSILEQLCKEEELAQLRSAIDGQCVEAQSILDKRFGLSRTTSKVSSFQALAKDYGVTKQAMHSQLKKIIEQLREVMK